MIKVNMEPPIMPDLPKSGIKRHIDTNKKNLENNSL